MNEDFWGLKNKFDLKDVIIKWKHKILDLEEMGNVMSVHIFEGQKIFSR